MTSYRPLPVAAKLPVRLRPRYCIPVDRAWLNLHSFQGKTDHRLIRAIMGHIVSFLDYRAGLVPDRKEGGW